MENKEVKYFIAFVYKTLCGRYIYKSDTFNFIHNIEELETIRKIEQLMASMINKENNFNSEVKEKDLTIIDFIKMN